MPYTTLATAPTPALVIYLLDVSYSMSEPLGDKRRIDVVAEALERAVKRMVSRAGKGFVIAPRYRVAMIAYSDHVWDLVDGAQTVDKIARIGFPKLGVMQRTDTALAFRKVKQLLEKELPALKNSPAPIVCHMTDGLYNGDDPEPIAREIMQMGVADGNVLIENIFISDQVLAQPIADPKQWPGVLPQTPLLDVYAEKLRAMSSPLPETYRLLMNEAGYQVAPGAVMMLPGTSPGLVEMGFVMSTTTPFTPPTVRRSQTID